MSEISPEPLNSQVLPWQQGAWQSLVELHHADRLPHAIMLAGQRGIGKRLLGEALSSLVLCTQPMATVACGSCRNCLLNKAGSHPDVLMIEPEEVGKAIKVDQIRRLGSFVANTSSQGGKKVLLIDPAEAMNINAANALLKNLEEPSGDTLIVLVCHLPSQVMATIKSRCQIKTLALPTQTQSQTWLAQQLSLAGDEMTELLEASSGAPLAAKALFDSGGLEQRRDWQQALIAVAEGRLSALEVAKKWYSQPPLPLVEGLLLWLNDMARVQAGAAGSQLPESLKSLAARVSAAYLYRYMDKTLQLKRQLLAGNNPNKQLLLEEALLDWQMLAA